MAPARTADVSDLARRAPRRPSQATEARLVCITRAGRLAGIVDLDNIAEFLRIRQALAGRSAADVHELLTAAEMGRGRPRAPSPRGTPGMTLMEAAGRAVADAAAALVPDGPGPRRRRPRQQRRRRLRRRPPARWPPAATVSVAAPRRPRPPPRRRRHRLRPLARPDRARRPAAARRRRSSSTRSSAPASTARSPAPPPLSSRR